MARINQYTQDENVTFGDKLLGSDSGGSTRNFSLESISDFFKQNNAGGVVGQFVWQHKTSTPSSGQMQAVFSSGSTFANLTSIKVNKYTKIKTPLQFRDSMYLYLDSLKIECLLDLLQD